MEAALRLINEMVAAGLVETYAIGGAMAALFYSEPIATFDLDVFLILPKEQTAQPVLTLQPQISFLTERGGVPGKEHLVVQGVPVQLLPAWNELVLEATIEAAARTVGQTQTRVCRLEHLIAILLQTGREKDRARLPLLLEGTPPDRSLLREILHRHALLERWKEWTGRPDV